MTRAATPLRAAFLALLLAGCADADQACRSPTALSEIPLLRLGGNVIVPVEIDGEPSGLFLDTGSFATSVTPPTVDALHLSSTRVIGQGFGRGTGVYANVSGLGGEGRYQAVDIDSLTLGGMVAHNVVALVIPLSREGRNDPVSGLIGQDFLAQWDLDLDVPHDQLTL